MELHPVGKENCPRCFESLPIPSDGHVLDAEEPLCGECAAELAAQPYTVTGRAVVVEAAGMPELNVARLVIEWADADTLVEPHMAVWLGGERVAEHYALALGGHALQQLLHVTVTVRPRTGTADLDALTA